MLTVPFLQARGRAEPLFSSSQVVSTWKGRGGCLQRRGGASTVERQRWVLVLDESRPTVQ